MKRIILLAVIGCLTLGGWAVAQQQELLNHIDDARMMPLANDPCSSSSSSSGGG